MLSRHPTFRTRRRPLVRGVLQQALEEKGGHPPDMYTDAAELMERVLLGDSDPAVWKQSRQGIQLVEEDVWLADVVWNGLLRQRLRPPYVPPTKAAAGGASPCYMDEDDGHGAAEDDGRLRDERAPGRVACWPAVRT
ncbi:uncharacterized protein PV07_08635 [Cladophialophora immunda]|uniref:AGC-kinase C-terminal domain-containing protein n=1 Tax=Cladophialophora immunda TaxID=569365 RepID=A0A0D2CPJ4_9EURO|nr:uncharacterized protein PV07_08635 [Cladophialophora immunda]KIW25469.1 hypothetical protein PV07_08635 [Cladophialophora immunda]